MESIEAYNFSLSDLLGSRYTDVVGPLGGYKKDPLSTITSFWWEYWRKENLYRGGKHGV